MGIFGKWLGWRGRADRSLSAVLEAVGEIKHRVANIERLLVRVQKDAERVKLHTGMVLGYDRALALLASGDRVYVDPRDGGCGINLLSEGRYEEEELRLLRRYLRPNACFLDVGANYGIYAITAAPYLRPGGRVIAFEPNPHIFGLLWSSLYLNGFFDVVDAQRLGASDANEEVRFEINESSPGGAHVLRPDDTSSAHHLVINVPVVRLDEHLAPVTRVDLVKIDVEGHEESVLRGMREIITRSPDIKIFMELFHSLFRSDEDFVSLVHFITDELGLTINRILPGSRTEEADEASLRGQTCNLLLSKGKLLPAPDLSIYPVQLSLGEGALLEDGALTWHSDNNTCGGCMIAHGPYVYLPRGRYRIIVDGAFEGRFLFRVSENYGDLLWQDAIGTGDSFISEVDLALDAPRLEIGFLTADNSPGKLRLRKVEFWPA